MRKRSVFLVVVLLGLPAITAGGEVTFGRFTDQRTTTVKTGAANWSAEQPPECIGDVVTCEGPDGTP